MIKVGVIGASGFIGSKIVEILDPKFRVLSITKENYNEFKEEGLDVLINANGNNKKYWANLNPQEDYIKSVESVNNTLVDFNFKKYILVSSIDAKGDTIYGRHKYLAEQAVIKGCPQFMILRCASVVGTTMSKGVVFDILNDKPIFLTPDSKLYFISNVCVAEIISQLIYQNIFINTIHDLFGYPGVAVRDMERILGHTVKYSSSLEKQGYDLAERNFNDIKYFYPAIETSEQYLCRCLTNSF